MDNQHTVPLTQPVQPLVPLIPIDTKKTIVDLLQSLKLEPSVEADLIALQDIKKDNAALVELANTTFDAAIACAEKGDPFDFFQQWSHPFAAPKSKLQEMWKHYL